jgi:hypothetical protein
MFSAFITLIPLVATDVETADSIEIRCQVLRVPSRANLFDTWTIFATNIGRIELMIIEADDNLIRPRDKFRLHLTI